MDRTVYDALYNVPSINDSPADGFRTGEYAVVLTLATMQTDDEPVIITRPNLQRASHVSLATLDRALKRLELLGWVKKFHHVGQRGEKSYLVTVPPTAPPTTKDKGKSDNSRGTATRKKSLQ